MEYNTVLMRIKPLFPNKKSSFNPLSKSTQSVRGTEQQLRQFLPNIIFAEQEIEYSKPY